jgi:serine phosphatase RsbU (regulator of sigma subunit)
MLQTALLAVPDEIPAIIADQAGQLGAGDAVLYLADLQQMALVPFVGSLRPRLHERVAPLLIDDPSTLGGQAFQLSETVLGRSEPGTTGVNIWLPVVSGIERLGVLNVRVAEGALAGAPGEVLRLRLRRLAALAAELVVAKGRHGDAVVVARRRAQMGLAAEIQWSLLPPMTFACQDLVVAAALEPAYEVAGDSVDYAVDTQVARVGVFDGMGHGLYSAQLAALAVAAYRNARRAGLSLPDTAAAVDAAVASAFAGDAFTTAVLAELDLTVGLLRWVNAGHPQPLLLRDGRMLRTLSVPPGLPFGLDLAPGRGAESVGTPAYTIGIEALQPGDRVLFYSDGIVEAQSPSGERFGLHRLIDLVGRSLSERLPAPEALRRLMRELLKHQQGRLTDDATMLMLEWRTSS